MLLGNLALSATPMALSTLVTWESLNLLISSLRAGICFTTASLCVSVSWPDWSLSNITLSPLFKSSAKKTEKEKKKLTLKDLKKDNYVEDLIRKLVAEDSSALCFIVYDVYKKAHEMASHDSPYE